MNSRDLLTKKDLEQLKDELIQKIEEGTSKSPSGSQKRWLRSSEVRELFQISPGTLQSLRIKGIIPYTRLGYTLYYPAEEINQILRKIKFQPRTRNQF